MNVITTLNQKRYEKQITFERKVLKELSLVKLQEQFHLHFSPFEIENDVRFSPVEENSIDMAIEAYLLGATMSRFGYFGEEKELVKKRCSNDLQELIVLLYEQFLTWEQLIDEHSYNPALYRACEKFINMWWDEGFIKGEKRHRLRLH